MFTPVSRGFFFGVSVAPEWKIWKGGGKMAFLDVDRLVYGDTMGIHCLLFANTGKY